MSEGKVVFLGVEEMRRSLETLKLGFQNRVIRAALNAGLTAGKADVKNQIPGKFKHIRRMVGKSLKRRSRGSEKGQVVGKLGIGTGISPGTRAALISTAKASHRQGGSGNKPGMGMSPQNVHWWVLGSGSKKRFHRSSSPFNERGPTETRLHSTGVMPPAKGKPVRTGVLQARPKMLSAMQAKFRERLVSEVNRLNNKRRNS